MPPQEHGGPCEGVRSPCKGERTHQGAAGAARVLGNLESRPHLVIMTLVTGTEGTAVVTVVVTQSSYFLSCCPCLPGEDGQLTGLSFGEYSSFSIRSNDACYTGCQQEERGKHEGGINAT